MAAVTLRTNQTRSLDSWDLFVLRHRKRGNLMIHFVSFSLYYISLIGLAITWNPWWLVGLFCSGGVGSMGHYIFDDGVVKVSEATYDPKVVFYVTVMFYKIFRGQYQQDILAAEGRYDAWLKEQEGKGDEPS